MTRGKYNLKLLKDIAERDICVIDYLVYQNISSREAKVDFTCKCGNDANKVFRQMYEYGGFCKDCTKKLIKEKSAQTSILKYGCAHPMHSQVIRDRLKTVNQEKYGVDYPFQSDIIQKKVKESHLERYGCERPLQFNEFKAKAKQTTLKNHGVENPMQSKQLQEKVKRTNTQRYGVEYTFQNENIKSTIKLTLIERYGVDNPMLVEEFKQKSKQTNLQKYGVESHNQAESIKEKKKQTTLLNYGVENPMQSTKVQNTHRKTCLLRYNVENPMQVAEFNDKSTKSGYKYKEFKFPCGEVRNVQGYEPYALHILVQQRYAVEDILTSKVDVPEIWYDFNNKKHRYFPDIYIPSENKIIEVKSTYTFEKEEEKNKLKANACSIKGYIFEFWIFDDKGNQIDDNNISCAED